MGRLFDDGEMSSIFFMAQRGRAVIWALRSFEAEFAMLGDDWNVNGLYSRENDIVFTAELMGLIARWDARPEVSISAALVSSGLRSAFWMWLEDDDRAMGVLRSVLEGIARIKTYQDKPEKAGRLRSRGSATTPRDWIEAAGWRRLKALNYALGDLAHTREGSQWLGSRDLLVALLPPDVPSDRAPNQGRGFALTAIVALAARVGLAVCQRLSADLGEAVEALFSSTGLFDGEVELRLDEWLARAWGERSFDFGEPVFNAGPVLGDPPPKNQLTQ